MHLSNTLRVAENFDSKGLHNIIANVLQMVLVDALVLSLHAFTKLKLSLPLEVDALIPYKVCMFVISSAVRLHPSTEIIRG